MEKFSVLLIIVAIMCALFSEKIDTTVKGDKKVKKVLVVFGSSMIQNGRIVGAVPHVLVMIRRVGMGYLVRICCSIESKHKRKG